MSKNIVIIRGISGAGKSTYVKKNFPNATICSADNYFINSKTGAYNFDHTKLGQAHGQCLELFKKAIEQEHSQIVVDNTNTTLREFRQYLQVASDAGYDVEVVRLEISLDVAAARNVHGVPYEAVKRMQGRFQDFPGEKVVFSQSN